MCSQPSTADRQERRQQARRAHLGEGDGALDALGALDDGALPDLLLLQQLLVDGVQQRLLRDLCLGTLQRLRAGESTGSGHREDYHPSRLPL